jgi:acetophenone carboxylase
MYKAITEYLAIDPDSRTWVCRNCGEELIDAEQNYKRGCLVNERDPREVHRPLVEKEYDFAHDPEWVRIVEFYCPGCATMVENEYLPPGHPITNDIDLDVDALVAEHEESA